MVQDQLVEYITTQIKAGVSGDAIKAALLGAGWQAADVEDSMKHVQGSAAGASVAGISATAKPSSTSGPSTSFPASFKPAASSSPSSSPASAGGPQVIRVSDLVSSSEKPSSFSTSTTNGAKADAVMSKIDASAKAAGTSSVKNFPSSSVSAGSVTGSAASSFSSASPVKAKKSYALATESVLGALMVIFAAFAVFLFLQNQGLSSRIAALNGQSSGVSSQISNIQQELAASTTAFQAQIASATVRNSMLALELSFYAVPPSMTPATTTFTTALEGAVSGGGRYDYAITTADGAKVYVTNSKDARVIALMKPLVGATSTMAKFAGNYVPGNDTITITAVNGASVAPPPAASTSTATTSAAAGAGAAATTTGK